MKKSIIIYLCAILTLCTVFAFAACGNGNDGGSGGTVLTDGSVSNITSLDKVYDGKAVSLPSYDKLGDGTISVEWYKGSELLPSAPVNAGTYKIVVKIAESDTYKAASAEKEFTISKATPEKTAPADCTAKYGQTLNDVTLPADENGTWTWENVSDDVGTVGTALHNAVFTPNDTINYNTVTLSVSVTVSVSTNKWTTAPNIASWVYGTPNSPNGVPDHGEVAFEYAVRGSNNYSSEKPINVGSYTLRATVAADGYTKLEATVNFEITKLTLTSPTENETAFTYNGAEQTYLPVGFNSDTMTVANNTRTNAGTQTVSVELKDAANYTWDTENAPKFSFTIAKAPLTVTADSLTVRLGSAVPDYYTATVTGFVGSDSVSDLTGELTFTCEYTSDTAIGADITIQIDTCYTSDNYLISAVDGHINVIGLENAWTVTPSIADWTYGNAVSIPVGEANGSGVTFEYKLSSEPDASYTETVPTYAGSYVMRATATKTSYEELVATVEFTIDKCALQKPDDDTSTFVFAEYELSYCPVGFDDEIMNISNNVHINAGTYTVTVSLSDTDNYKWAGDDQSDPTYSFVIAPSDDLSCYPFPVVSGHPWEGNALSTLTLIGDETQVSNTVTGEIVDGLFQWKTPSETILLGANSYKVVFTPFSSNYSSFEFSISVTGEEGLPVTMLQNNGVDYTLSEKDSHIYVKAPIGSNSCDVTLPTLKSGYGYYHYGEDNLEAIAVPTKTLKCTATWTVYIIRNGVAVTEANRSQKIAITIVENDCMQYVKLICSDESETDLLADTVPTVNSNKVISEISFEPITSYACALYLNGTLYDANSFTNNVFLYGLNHIRIKVTQSDNTVRFTDYSFKYSPDFINISTGGTSQNNVYSFNSGTDSVQITNYGDSNATLYRVGNPDVTVTFGDSATVSEGLNEFYVLYNDGDICVKMPIGVIVQEENRSIYQSSNLKLTINNAYAADYNKYLNIGASSIDDITADSLSLTKVGESVAITAFSVSDTFLYIEFASGGSNYWLAYQLYSQKVTDADTSNSIIIFNSFLEKYQSAEWDNNALTVSVPNGSSLIITTLNPDAAVSITSDEGNITKFGYDNYDVLGIIFSGADGTYTVVITITATDGTTTAVYTVTVTIAPQEVVGISPSDSTTDDVHLCMTIEGNVPVFSGEISVDMGTNTGTYTDGAEAYTFVDANGGTLEEGEDVYVKVNLRFAIGDAFYKTYEGGTYSDEIAVTGNGVLSASDVLLKVTSGRYRFYIVVEGSAIPIIISFSK